MLRPIALFSAAICTIVACSGRVAPSDAGDATADAATDADSGVTDVTVADADADASGAVPKDAAADVAADIALDVQVDIAPPGPTYGTDGKGANMQVVSWLALAEKASSCDLNGDGKPDNALAGIASLIGSNLEDAVKQGKLVALLDPSSFDSTGLPWTYAVWMGGNTTTGTCDPGQCAYQISQQNFSGVNCGANKVCFSKASFTASVSKGVLTATSPEVDMIWPLNGSYVGMSMVNLTVKGPITVQGGKWLGSSHLMVCGAMTAINATFDTASLTKPDIDTNGDGVPDAVSFAILFDTVTATVSP